MPYPVFYNDAEKIVEATISGSSLEDSVNAREAAARLCAEQKCSALLVDLRERMVPENITLQCFSFGVAVAHDLAGIYIAHVLPTDLKSREDVEFAATVAANRGAITKEFIDINEARKWLRQRIEPARPD